MRLYQQFRASYRASRRRRAPGSSCSLPASRCPLSDRRSRRRCRRRPARPPRRHAARRGAPAGASTRPCGWRSRTTSGVQTEQLNPQIQVLGRLAGARGLRAALFGDTLRSISTAPPTDFLSAGIADHDQRHVRRPAAACSRTCGGAAAATTRRRSTGRASRRTPSNDVLQPAARLEPQRRLHPAAAARTSRSTRCAQDAAAEPEPAADRPTCSCSSASRRRRARCAAPTTTLVGAIAGLEVAQESLDLAQQSLKNNQTPRRSRHDGADRHHRGGGGSRAATRRT